MSIFTKLAHALEGVAIAMDSIRANKSRASAMGSGFASRHAARWILHALV